MAAYTAAEAGVDVTVIDENPLPGGQYLRQSPPEFTIPDVVAAHSGHPEAAALYRKLEHPRIRTMHNTSVWGVFDGRMLALAERDRVYLHKANRVVIATGAYDRPLAFPGWTLPGILGAGAVMRMVKTQWVLPGKRVLLAGLGPLQLPLADLLLESGVEVVCVAEAANLFLGWRHLSGFWGHGDRIWEAYTYIKTLVQHRVPVFHNHAIVSASGKEQVETATIARLDGSGQPIAGTERQFEVDTVCLGYGFLPSIQLAMAFGCEPRFDENLSWFVPRHNDHMETTEPGIFVAGDVTDFGGAKVALAEGRVAGLAAAHQLGALDDATFNRLVAPALAELRHMNRVALALQRIYRFRRGLAFLASDDTILCRCEDVTLAKVKQALADGAIDLHQVKLGTRAGMGYCQGRCCSALIAPIVAKETKQSISTLHPFTVRPPIQPIPLQMLATGAVSMAVE